MRHIVNGNHSRLEFDSIADLLAVVRRHREVLYDREIDSRPEYFGDIRSVDHLFELACIGWEVQLDDTLRVAEETVATVERSYDVPLWQSRYDIGGADVDVSRYLSGEPENMISYHLVETPRTGRVVSLAMNIGATYDVSTEDMIKRGKSVVSLVYALERIGLRTELYTDAQAKSMGSGRETAREMVKIKDAADALDPAMVMFAYAHPAFLRGMLLTAMHEHPARIQDSLKVGSAYGIPLKSLANDVFPEGCIILSTVMRSGDHSVSNVEAFVVKHLKDLGLI